MNEEFEYMVTPLVFNVCLKMKCEGDSCKIEAVYGGNKDNQHQIISNGEITKIHTLFPSKRSEKSGKTKGGIQLIKLKKMHENDDNVNVSLEVTFEDRNGKKFENIQNISFDAPRQKLIDDMIDNDEEDETEMEMDFYDNVGIRKAILLCKYVDLMKRFWGRNEKGVLWISDGCKEKMTKFREYFKTEMQYIGDDSLQQEIDMMLRIISSGT